MIGRPAIELVGRRFGRWVVLRRDAGHHRNLRWVCRCECGTERSVEGSSLSRGQSVSCGCRGIELQTKHGLAARGSAHEIYGTWVQMVGRCHNPNHAAFAYYGARGINVCDRWRNSVEAFIAEVGPRPLGLTLDRIDNDGNYEPGNVRWATKSQQQRNRRGSAEARRSTR